MIALAAWTAALVLPLTLAIIALAHSMDKRGHAKFYADTKPDPAWAKRVDAMAKSYVPDF